MKAAIIRRMSFSLFQSGLLILGIMAQVVSGAPNPATTPTEKGEDKLPEVSVELLGPLDLVKGIDWPRVYDWVHKKPDQPDLMATIEKPHEIVVHLPDGRTLRHFSKLTFITQQNGKVITVKLIPSTNLLGFQQTITELEELLKEWNAAPSENETNETTKQRLAEWKRYGDLKTGPWALSKPGGADIHGESKADIFFKIRPGDGGWFLSITIGPTLDVIKSMYAPSTRSATKPSDTKPSVESGN